MAFPPTPAHGAPWDAWAAAVDAATRDAALLTVDASDTQQTATRRTKFTDLAPAKGSLVQVDHHGDGTGNTASPGQAYAVDVHNFPGAASAIVVHQYSSATPAVWIDNTDSQPAVRILNTENQGLNPGHNGSGAFFQLKPWTDTDYLYLTDDLRLYNRTTKTLSVDARNTTGSMFKVNSGSNADIDALTVSKTGTGVGIGVDIANAGTGIGLRVTQSKTGAGAGIAQTIDQAGNAIALKVSQSGAQSAVQIVASAGAAGRYILDVAGYDYGPKVATSNDGGVLMDLFYNGTGVGTGLQVTHKGTGRAFAVLDAAGERFAVTSKGVVYMLKQSAQPSSSTASGTLYVATDGSLHYRGTTGTDTLIGPA